MWEGSVLMVSPICVDTSLIFAGPYSLPSHFPSFSPISTLSFDINSAVIFTPGKILLPTLSLK